MRILIACARRDSPGGNLIGSLPPSRNMSERGSATPLNMRLPIRHFTSFPPSALRHIVYTATMPAPVSQPPLFPLYSPHAILAFQFSSWYPQFAKHSIKSTIVRPLSSDFRQYLDSDGVFVPDGAEDVSVLRTHPSTPLPLIRASSAISQSGGEFSLRRREFRP